MKTVRWLIWLYFYLLIFEGAVRKWGGGGLDQALLLVRDPVALLIIVLAAQRGLLPSNIFIALGVLLAVCTGLASLAVDSNLVNSLHGKLIITLFGMRTNFLHVPLIFIIPKVFTQRDVLRLGAVVLVIMVGMAVLVSLQFRAPPDSVLNVGSMQTHYGGVRPSGTFSFVTGLVCFHGWVAVFLAYGFLRLGTYRFELLALASTGLVTALVFSGSRSAVASVLIIFGIMIMLVFFHGKSAPGLFVALFLGALIVTTLERSDFIEEGKQQLLQRFNDVASSEDTSITGSLYSRAFGDLLSPLTALADYPLFGMGTGMGTNVASYFLTGERVFLVGEGEWSRLLGESGPLLGLALIAYRVGIFFHILHYVFAALLRRNLLPILFFGASSMLLVTGQWGPPTTLGFAVFGCGLTLAACREDRGEVASKGQRRRRSSRVSSEPPADGLPQAEAAPSARAPLAPLDLPSPDGGAEGGNVSEGSDASGDGAYAAEATGADDLPVPEDTGPREGEDDGERTVVEPPIRFRGVVAAWNKLTGEGSARAWT